MNPDIYNISAEKNLKLNKSQDKLSQSLLSHCFDFSTLSNSSFSNTLVSPGPGEYLYANPAQPSYSIKGYGGLINRERRFNSIGIPRNPGPGAYETPDLKTISIASPFARQIPKRIIKKKVPDPVHYDIKPQSTKKKYDSAFKSQSKRMQLVDPNTPSPWHYHPSLPKSQSCLVVLKKKKTEKKTFGLTPEDENSTPGPGMYEIPRKIGVEKKIFKEENKVDNKVPKNLEKKPLPGPGAYYKGEAVEKTPVSSSFFLSAIPKESQQKKKCLAPGPAYYFPNIQDKKISFLFNPQSVWR